jgi:DNA-binding MarR family transcriptional regulator
VGENRWLDAEEQRAWRALIALVNQLPLALDRQLQTEAGIGHTDYTVLAMLSEAPGRSLRMSELAEATATSPSRLSHAVARLADRGWVERRPCPTDRRGQVATLTEAGYDVLEGIAPGHAGEVARLVFDPLSKDQVRHLEELATTITGRVDVRASVEG